MHLIINRHQMKKLRIILRIIIFSLSSLNGFSQYEKNAVVLDLLGKSVYYFDISYERYLSEKFHLGTGIGLSEISTWDDVGTINTYNFPLYAGFALGKKKHHAISELGIHFDWVTNFEGYNNFELYPFFSFGYEYKGDNILFRVPIYLFYTGEFVSAPPLVPWIGLSVGVPF